MIDGEFEDDFGINYQSENGQVQMCSLFLKLFFDFKQGFKFGDYDFGGIVCVWKENFVILDFVLRKMKMFKRVENNKNEL